MHIKLLSAAFLAITWGSDLAGADGKNLGIPRRKKKQRHKKKVETKPLHGPLSTLVSLSLSLAVFSSPHSLAFPTFPTILVLFSICQALQSRHTHMKAATNAIFIYSILLLA